jgi:hypothetical protein
LPNDLAIRKVTIAISAMSNAEWRTIPLKPLHTGVTSLKSNATRGDATSPLFSAAVCG